MSHRLEGQRFWKVGDHSHVWTVDGVVDAKPEAPPFAILVSQDGTTVEEVDLSHLENANLYTPVPPDHPPS